MGNYFAIAIGGTLTRRADCQKLRLCHLLAFALEYPYCSMAFYIAKC